MVTDFQSPTRQKFHGVCPVCRDCSSCIFDSGAYWCTCHEHKAKWRAKGAEHRDCYDDEEFREALAVKELSTYHDVEPIYLEVEACERCGAEAIRDESKNHHHICHYNNGQKTELSADEVRRVILVLKKLDCHIQRNRDDWPF